VREGLRLLKEHDEFRARVRESIERGSSPKTASTLRSRSTMRSRKPSGILRPSRRTLVGSVPHIIPRPKAVLFDLFHTLACVPPPALAGESPVPEILGVAADEWQRLYYDEDVLGRCTGRIVDGVEAMRIVTHSIDPTVPEDRIVAAVESRRRRFESG